MILRCLRRGRPGRPPLRSIILALALFAAPAASQQRAAGWLQADGFYHAVTNDFGDWKGVGLRAVVPSSQANIWHGELE